MASHGGGSPNPNDGQNPAFTTSAIIGAIPSAYFSIASIALGPTTVANNHPWWTVLGAAAGVVTLSSGIAYAASNTKQMNLAVPYLVTGIVAGVPSLAFAVYGWAAKAPIPAKAVEVLSKANVTLAPPMPTVLATPNGSTGVGVSLLSGRF
jgi:hypothetical protein